MTTLKILIAHCRYQQRGGEDVVVEAECDLLKRHGHHVELYERDNHDIDGMTRAQLASQTVWSARTSRELGRVLADFRPHIVHAHNTFPLISPSLYWVAERAGIPLVQTLHNFRLLCPQAMLLREGRVCEDCVGKLPWAGVIHKCYHDSVLQSGVLALMLGVHRQLGSFSGKVARYIALNQFCRDKFVSGGLPAHKMAIKPNFVDIALAPDRHRAGGLFVGRLSPEKGVTILLRALARLPDVTIAVIGEGPEQGKIAASPGIVCLGWQEQPQIVEQMRKSAYLVMPSIWYENFPRTLVEAFACGLPVIASRLGALAELVSPGTTGLLFEPGSAEDLAEKIAWAEANPQEMIRMGINVRAKYEASYTPEKNYERLIEIYMGAIAAVKSARTYRMASA